ncbi:MAG TPA: Rid family hydrolase [Steroidobacteraceae bacterium]|nr:Rid family hydrolase [Steroidobacteraceae bacterium]
MNTASLQLDYVSSDELAAQSASWWRTVLGVVGFEKPPQIDLAQVPVTASMTPSLGAADNLCEVWRVAGGHDLELSTGSLRQGRVHYRYCDELLFGSITVDEDGFDGSGSAALLRATTTAYQEIFGVLKETQHRHLIRVWNYLPEINREADGDERYRHFNSARQTAFLNSGRSTIGTVPAASALGSPAGSPISIYFLASHQPPTMIENPRQTSAYYYPPKFGTYSPTFSRACVLSESAGTNLFVSGTASIVGHETIHRGDVAAQTRETLANIDALLDEANRVVGAAHYSLEGLKFKVYVRRASDLAAIESALAAALCASTSIVYLQADVCREDLLVEIEATGESRRN